MKEVELIQVIRTKITRRGAGIPADPVRIVEQYWSLTGDLLAEVDMHTSAFVPPNHCSIEKVFDDQVNLVPQAERIK